MQPIANDLPAQDAVTETAARKAWTKPALTEVVVADVTLGGGYAAADASDYDS